jgi:hypothetical protein
MLNSLVTMVMNKHYDGLMGISSWAKDDKSKINVKYFV